MRVISDAFRKRLQDEHEALLRQVTAPGFMENAMEEFKTWINERLEWSGEAGEPTKVAKPRRSSGTVQRLRRRPT